MGTNIITAAPLLFAAQEAAPDDGHLMYWIIGAAVAISVVLWLFRGRCPQCKRFRALEYTGQSNGRMSEMRCRHCGETLWRDTSSSGTGGDHGDGDGGGD